LRGVSGLRLKKRVVVGPGPYGGAYSNYGFIKQPVPIGPLNNRTAILNLGMDDQAQRSANMKEPEVVGSGRGNRTTDVSILGGRKFKGRWRPPKEMTLVSVLGGREIDLREAEIDPDGITINVVGLIGGTHIIVPEGVNVEISGFSGLGGRRVDSRAEPGPAGARRVRVRAFGVVGGLKVESGGLS
jgi:Cell wall-active antibiotics response LiaF, C-terminal